MHIMGKTNEIEKMVYEFTHNEYGNLTSIKATADAFAISLLDVCFIVFKDFKYTKKTNIQKETLLNKTYTLTEHVHCFKKDGKLYELTEMETLGKWILTGSNYKRTEFFLYQDWI